MTTLITGATGHLGANLVRALLQRGERIRVLVRRTSDRRAIQGLDVEVAEGDLKDAGSLTAAVAGCTRIYHLAALISLRGIDRDELFDVNVLGTRRLLHAARRAGVGRIVHTSSLGAVGTNPRGACDEDWVLNPFEPVMDYERSKAAAEHEVLREVVRGLDVVMVNPSAVVGPWDYRPSHVGRTILDLAAGRLRAYVPGQFDWVPARSVVEGHLAAMDRGRTGERYLLTGEVVTIDAILDLLADATRTRRPTLRLPPGPMRSLSLVKDWIEEHAFPERQPRFNAQSIRLLNSGKRPDNGKARRELGYEPGPVSEAFREAVEWFRDHGYI